jgi:crossover junction endodeoxyribonuclease RuvC
MVIAASVRFGATIDEISPSEAKRRVTGNGNAAKSQVAAMVPRLVAMPDVELPEDATDALALALAHARRLELDRATGGR